MSENLEIREIPKADEIYMIAGWRQWADAGSISSGLPQYLVQLTNARYIGKIRTEGFYLFQLPGTHDLIRPVVKFDQGFPESLQTQRNEFFFSGDERRGLVIFIGDEPHQDIDRYTSLLLEAAQQLSVKRIIGLGGVYGEFPFNKERSISSVYSLPKLKAELERYAVRFSDYHGGASIGSFICKRAGEQNIEYMSFYGFVPAYDFTEITQLSSSIRIENDYMAWMGIMQRVKAMLNLEIDLSDLERRSSRLIKVVNEKIDELEKSAPQLGIREYFERISDNFSETPFEPLDDIWEEKLRRILDKFDEEDELPS
jgi:proteasome assembly chaperone (PAC2) family protein